MRYADNPERERVVDLALSAKTLEELEMATRELDTWVAAHPDDTGILDAYEQMALVELALREMTVNHEEVPTPLATI